MVVVTSATDNEKEYIYIVCQRNGKNRSIEAILAIV